MDIVIFGASGRTGIELVRQALFYGHRVTAFVRKRDSFQYPMVPNLIVVEGSLNDPDQVLAVVRGKHAVISALGVSKTLHHDPEVVRGINMVVHAMNKEKVNRLIYLSVFLADSKPRQFSFFVDKILSRIIRREVQDHEAKEKIIRDHIKAYTIVRPTRLTNWPLTGKYRHGETIAIGDFIPSVSRGDVANFMLKQLDGVTYLGKSVLITGTS